MSAEAMIAAEDFAESALVAGAFAAAVQAARADALLRIHRARALGAAIADCDRADALAVMSAALVDMGAGLPELCAVDDLRRQALWWADTAAEIELVEYACAALARLQESPLGLPHRKRLIAALWQALPDADRRAFLARVDPRGTFQGRRA